MNEIKIVIVEDEPIVMAGLCSIISAENCGWKIIGTADNGQQGLELIEELKPDIILTDIRMPYFDGLELIKRVRQINDAVIIIILTGHADFNYAQFALKFKAFDYILKPSSPTEIISVLKKAEAAIVKVSQPEYNNEQGKGRKTALLIFEALTRDTAFLDSLAKKDIAGFTEKYAEETEKNGLWSIELRRSVIVSEIVFIRLIDKLLESRMIKLSNYLESKNNITKFYQVTSVTELQKLSNQFLHKLSNNINTGSSVNILIIKAFEHINMDISRDMPLKDVADKLFLNYSYFSQLFKKETGMNFSDYLIYIRMEKARELLKDVTCKTYEVAYKVGYKNSKHFSFTFKKTYGLSPSDYRNMFFE